MTPLPGEEWLSQQESALRGRLSKAIQSFVAIVGPLLILVSGMPAIQKVATSGLYILMLLCLWLLSWLAFYRSKVRQLEGDIAGLSLKSTPELGDLEFSILEMVYDCYPERLTRDELKRRIVASEIDFDCALLDLTVKKFLIRPRGGLYRIGQPNPNGYGISGTGSKLAKTKKNEQVAAEQPAISFSIS
jgi:hypothetical protein